MDPRNLRLTADRRARASNTRLDAHDPRQLRSTQPLLRKIPAPSPNPQAQPRLRAHSREQFSDDEFNSPLRQGSTNGSPSRPLHGSERLERQPQVVRGKESQPRPVPAPAPAPVPDPESMEIQSSSSPVELTPRPAVSALFLSEIPAQEPSRTMHL